MSLKLRPAPVALSETNGSGYPHVVKSTSRGVVLVLLKPTATSGTVRTASDHASMHVVFDDDDDDDEDGIPSIV